MRGSSILTWTRFQLIFREHAVSGCYLGYRIFTILYGVDSLYEFHQLVVRPRRLGTTEPLFCPRFDFVEGIFRSTFCHDYT